MGSCGGALVARNAVLFAAHCGNYIGHQVVIGSSHTKTLDGGAQARFCVDVVQHPGYENKRNWDFALCKLDSPVEVDEERVKLE